MAPRSSMSTKTKLLEKTTFPLKFGQNGGRAKARSQSQRRFGHHSKAISKVEIPNNIVHGLYDFCQLV